MDNLLHIRFSDFRLRLKMGGGLPRGEGGRDPVGDLE